MTRRLFAILTLVSLIVLSSPGTILTTAAIDSPQFILTQAADLQFTEDMVLVSVEQGGSNTAYIRVHNYGGEIGSANITFQGLEPDGITVELSTTSIIDLNGGSYQDITVNVNAAAGLWPLGPRRLDLGLMNTTHELDTMYLEMNVVAPTTTTTSGILGIIPIETIVLSVIATAVVVIVVVLVRRRR